MHRIAQAYGVAGTCPPTNFYQLWCLVDDIVAQAIVLNLEVEQELPGLDFLELEQGGFVDLE